MDRSQMLQGLSATALERLKVGLQEEVTRYREAIRGYSAEKIAQYGEPYLAELEHRVSEVERVQVSRSAGA